MAKNITIAGASYSAVPSIDVPQTGGGSASFSDIDFEKFYFDREILTFDTAQANVNDIMAYAAHLYEQNHPGVSVRCVAIQIVDKSSWSAKDLLSWTNGWVYGSGWYGRLWRRNSANSDFEEFATNSGSYYDTFVSIGDKADALFSIIKSSSNSRGVIEGYSAKLSKEDQEAHEPPIAAEK